MFRPIALAAALATAVAAPPAVAKTAPRATAAPKEPLDVARDFYKALHAGNAKAAAKLAAGEGVEPALRSFVQITESYRKLEGAIAKRFGADAAAVVGYGRKVQEEIKSLLGATVEQDGASARVLAMDGRTITTLRNVEGAWRVELEEALETPEGQAALARHARATQAAAKEVSARLQAGKYDSPRAALDDFEDRVARAAGATRRRQAGPPAIPDDGGAQL